VQQILEELDFLFRKQSQEHVKQIWYICISKAGQLFLTQK